MEGRGFYLDNLSWWNDWVNPITMVDDLHELGSDFVVTMLDLTNDQQWGMAMTLQAHLHRWDIPLWLAVDNNKHSASDIVHQAKKINAYGIVLKAEFGDDLEESLTLIDETFPGPVILMQSYISSTQEEYIAPYPIFSPPLPHNLVPLYNITEKSMAFNMEAVVELDDWPYLIKGLEFIRRNPSLQEVLQ